MMEKKDPVRRPVIFTLLPVFVILLLLCNHQGSFSSYYSGNLGNEGPQGLTGRKEKGGIFPLRDAKLIK